MVVQKPKCQGEHAHCQNDQDEHVSMRISYATTSDVNNFSVNILSGERART